MENKEYFDYAAKEFYINDRLSAFGKNATIDLTKRLKVAEKSCSECLHENMDYIFETLAVVYAEGYKNGRINK